MTGVSVRVTSGMPVRSWTKEAATWKGEATSRSASGAGDAQILDAWACGRDDVVADKGMHRAEWIGVAQEIQALRVHHGDGVACEMRDGKSEPLDEVTKALLDGEGDVVSTRAQPQRQRDVGVDVAAGAEGRQHDTRHTPHTPEKSKEWTSRDCNAPLDARTPYAAAIYYNTDAVVAHARAES